MSYFSQVLTAKAYSLRLPRNSIDEAQTYIKQHQVGVSPEQAPFRRQLDFWIFCVCTAVSLDLGPLDQPSSRWGRKFVDTRSVEMSEAVCGLLGVVAFYTLGHKHEGINNPQEIIEINNRLAGAGCSIVLSKLKSRDLRLTPLDKALNFAASMVKSKEG